MKKLLVGTMITAGTLFMGGGLTSAYGGDPDGSVSPLPPLTGGIGGSGTPSPTATPLPATGSESQMLLQVGLVTVVAGGALVGASAMRRRRLAVV